MHKPLTAAAVAKYKPGSKRRVLRDAGARSLYLVVMPSGHKSWLMRFRRPDGKPGKIVLGPVNVLGDEVSGEPVIGMPLTVKAARVLAAQVHRQRAMGTDVVADHKTRKRRVRTEAASREANTFGAAVRQYVAEYARPKTRRWRETARVLGLRYPIGAGEPCEAQGGLAARWTDRAVGQIDSHDIYEVVDEARRRGIPGVHARTKSLSDARGRAVARTLSKLFGWLLQHRKISANPCAGVYCPPAPAARDRVLTAQEVRLFWEVTERMGQPFATLLRLLLLTGQRLNEVAGMRRDELHDDGNWHIPGSRTKNRRPHIVPLPSLARDLLAALPQLHGCPYVFSTTGRSPVSGWSKCKAKLDGLMQEAAEKEDASAALPSWRLHDLRRSAVTGMAELGIAPQVIEAVVNHVSGHKGGVAGVYNRATYADEKRIALERWATQVSMIASPVNARVLAFNRQRRGA